MLHWAASGGHAAVVGLLLEKGALANALDESGWSALHIAVSGGRTEIVDALLSAGADPFAINGSGQLALHYAASRDRRDAARLLLSAAGERAAAMASFPDRAQNTPLQRPRLSSEQLAVSSDPWLTHSRPAAPPSSTLVDSCSAGARVAQAAMNGA